MHTIQEYLARTSIEEDKTHSAEERRALDDTPMVSCRAIPAVVNRYVICFCEAYEDQGLFLESVKGQACGFFVLCIVHYYDYPHKCLCNALNLLFNLCHRTFTGLFQTSTTRSLFGWLVRIVAGS